jgi:hypothetical protein
MPDPCVDLAAKYPKINGLGEKRFRAGRQLLVLGFRVPIRR